MTQSPPNPALQRTQPARRGSNRRVPQAARIKVTLYCISRCWPAELGSLDNPMAINTLA